MGVSLSLFLIGIFFFSPETPAITLREAYESAKGNTGLLRNQILNEEGSRVRQQLVTGSIRPKLSLLTSQLLRDVDAGSSSSSSSSLGSNEKHQHSVYLNLTQPLFQGGGEYHLLEAAKFYPEVSKWSRIQTEIDLYTDLAKSMYEILSLNKEDQTLKEQERILERRVSYLRSRVKIGRSRKSELFTAESQLANLSAEIQSIQGKILLAKETFVRQTGLREWSPVEDPLSEDWYSKLDLSGQSEKLEAVPQTQLIESSLGQTRAEVNAAKGDYWPQIDLSGNYYLDRTGTLKDSQWDVSLIAKWELYGGGTTQAAVREKTLEAEKLNYELADAKRNQLSITERLRNSLVAKMEEIKKIGLAVEMAERSYQENINESQSGLVSDLEVLRSLDDYLKIKRSYDRVQFEPKMIYFEYLRSKGVQP
ncbi:MAG: TolC family protein [Bdellovibrionales bacterium]|nr:TolC family protein [Bdellovibrionales bacterium]